MLKGPATFDEFPLFHRNRILRWMVSARMTETLRGMQGLSHDLSFSSVCTSSNFASAHPYFGFCLKGRKIARNSEHCWQNSKLRNYTEKKRFSMQKGQLLRHWVISSAVANYRFGRSRGPEQESLLGPTWTNPLVEAFLLFPYVNGWLPHVIYPLPASLKCAQRGSRSRGMHKHVPITLTSSLSVFVPKSEHCDPAPYAQILISEISHYSLLMMGTVVFKQQKSSHIFWSQRSCLWVVERNRHHRCCM